MSDEKKMILYVDDDQDFLDVMRVMLEKNGYEMTEATSAEAGLKAYKASKPDLLIVDLMMEEVDAGTTFVRELKALGNTAPVIMLSSVGDDLSQTMDASQLGLAGVLQKPVDEQRLISLLKRKLA